MKGFLIKIIDPKKVLKSFRLKEFKYTLYVIRKNNLSIVGLFGLTSLFIIALIAPYIVPYPEDALGATHPERVFLPPSFEHPFGTDDLGRDIFSRVLYGTRIELVIGLIVISLSLIIGLPLGIISGYFGGFVGEFIMRITDMFLSFPPLLLALAISVSLGPSLTNAMIAIAIAWWPWYSRLAYEQTISIREKQFIEAAKATGISEFRILFYHILPNCLTPLIVQASMDLGSVILTAASLSFLGLGAQPPQPEWGLMCNIGRIYFLTNWWVATFPGLAIVISVLILNLLGDGLRDILDPKSRRFWRR
ncbi:MAG: ABC transporter permease [Nitrososphaerota archaeon]